VHFTTDNKSEFTLDELLASGKVLKEQTGKPVLILLGHRISPEGPYTVSKWELSIDCRLYCFDCLHEVRKARQ
jgi:hypothetical protein